MTFKQNWEKTDEEIQISHSTIEGMLDIAFPNQKPFWYEIISGGCSNLNIKFCYANQSEPLILRIYLRDKEGVFREQKLAALIHEEIPIPKMHYVGDFNDYQFGIFEYKKGITLRELILSGQVDNVKNIMMEVGLVLAKIQSYRFPRSGFFGKDLQIIQPITQAGYKEYAESCLMHPITIQQLSKEYLSLNKFYLDKYHKLFPDHSQNHLVHADYDPANILLHNSQGGWKISAILDWEFAFSGSSLCDVANILRYAHQMPPEFEESFLSGLQKGGVQLQENWRISILLLNLVSLLDCLTRSHPDKQPNRCTDIRDLINFFLQQLNNSIK